MSHKMKDTGNTAVKTVTNTAAKTVTIIALCYNEKEFLKTLLDSIKGLDYDGKIQAILVDNASADGSADYVEKNFPWAKLIRNDKNIGTPGFNLALPYIQGEYVVWVGSDTKFQKDAIRVMAEELDKNPDVGGLYPHVVDFDGKHIEGWYCFSRTLYFFSILEETEKKEYSAIGPGMIRKEILDTVKYIYDPDYFYSYEDVDLCLRMRLLGYKVEYNWDAILYHKGSISFNKRNKPARLVFLGDRNSLITFLKIASPATMMAYLPYNLLLRTALILKEFATLRFGAGLARIRSIAWCIMHFGRIIKKRQEAQAYRKANDKFVFGIADEKKFIKEALKKIFTRETFDVQKFHSKHRKSATKEN